MPVQSSVIVISLKSTLLTASNDDFVIGVRVNIGVSDEISENPEGFSREDNELPEPPFQ